MSFLLAEHLRVTKGGRAILDDVSLEAGSGEFIAVIGPNGAGKSTLLSVLAGLTRPKSGEVSLDGKFFSEIPRKILAARRAYLPQNPLCEWPLSVERLVALGLTPHLPAFGGLPLQFAPAIGKALEACDLTSRRNQPVTTLSGGEFSRAMLARALVGEPEILIVDEPVTGLDPRHAMDCARRLSDYAAGGKLVIAALHDLTLAVRHAGRIVALKDGKVAGQGALTAALIGRVFDVEAEIRGEGEHASVTVLR
ncbi:MAG TPA: ABC transporter ATP-binding protein [Rhizomicrobium sp.]|nr:ABC transporter ATP-binding protein [Rhizomicrobium sp.]